MSIKIGHASADENRKASDGEAGDQTGGEVCIRTWYSSPWDCVLRPKNAQLAEKSAQACEAACANDKIGYDQLSRNTLYDFAKRVNFDLNKIIDKCECDCSSLMHVCAIAGGANLSYGYNAMWTGNMVEGFTANGEYEALTDAKYLISDAYLKRGDILLNSKSHTAMALQNGAVEKTTATTNVTLNVLKTGSVGNDVKTLQILLIGYGYDVGTWGADGELGSATDKAIKSFQKDNGLIVDSEVGNKTWTKLLGM